MWKVLMISLSLAASNAAYAQPKTGAGSLLQSNSAASVSNKNKSTKSQDLAKAAAKETAKAAAERAAIAAAKKFGPGALKGAIKNGIKFVPYANVVVGVLTPVQLSPD